MNYMNLMIALSAPNPSGFFGGIKDITVQWVTAGVDNLLIPIGIVVTAAIMLVIIIKAGIEHKRNQGDDLFERLKPALICAIIIAVLATKSTWWGFLVGGGV